MMFFCDLSLDLWLAFFLQITGNGKKEEKTFFMSGLPSETEQKSVPGKYLIPAKRPYEWGPETPVVKRAKKDEPPTMASPPLSIPDIQALLDEEAANHAELEAAIAAIHDNQDGTITGNDVILGAETTGNDAEETTDNELLDFLFGL